MCTIPGKVSVIVPAYNAEKYIDNCLRSLKSQQGVSAEFIIIDDGSDDNTYSIALRYAEDDPRFTVVTQKNSGVSQTRNRGLDLATGEYVSFVDSDDHLLGDNALLLMKTKIEEYNADVVVFGNEQGGTEIVNVERFSEERVVSSADSTEGLARETLTNSRYRTSVWNKFYRKSVIDEDSVRFFSYSEVISEDCVFNANIFPNIKRVLFIPDILYHYEVVEGSLSHRGHYDNIIQRNKNTTERISDRFVKDTKFLPLISYYYVESLFRVSRLSIYHNKDTVSEANGILKQYVKMTYDIWYNASGRAKAKRVMKKGLKRCVYGFMEFLLRCKLLFILRFCLIVMSELRK